MNNKKRNDLYSRLAKNNPNPTTELKYRTPYQLLISVILSAQATDVSVNKATEKLFKVAKTPSAMVKLGEHKLKSYIKTIGLFNGKAKNIIATSKILLKRHSAKVPRDRASLEALPGVGRKTANVILNTAFGEPTIAVDTHIFRIANRTGLAHGKYVRIFERQLEKVTPETFKRDAQHWLILHGRYICKARKPLCPECIIADLCDYKSKKQ